MSCSSQKTDQETNFLGSENQSFEGVRKNASGKSPPPHIKKSPGKLTPAKLSPGKCLPGKISPQKNFREKCSGKNSFFVAVDIVL